MFAPASRWTSSNKRPAVSEAPRITLPQPRMPAATAPCSASGAAASVMRAACTLGTKPCSAIATSVASSTASCAAFGCWPVSSSQKYALNDVWPINSLHRSRPRTLMLCSSDVLIAVRGTVDLPIFIVGMSGWHEAEVVVRHVIRLVHLASVGCGARLVALELHDQAVAHAEHRIGIEERAVGHEQVRGQRLVARRRHHHVDV